MHVLQEGSHLELHQRPGYDPGIPGEVPAAERLPQASGGGECIRGVHQGEQEVCACVRVFSSEAGEGCFRS